MGTTFDLPDDLHALVQQLAHDGNRSISDVITELIRLGLRESAPASARSSRGIPLVSVGRAVTADDVRSLDDDS